MRPDSKGNLAYQGGTGYGGDGAKIEWAELGNTFGHSAAALGTGFSGIGLLAAPEPTGLTKALAVAAFAGFGYEASQAWGASNSFNRSIDAASRLYLDQNASLFMP